MTLTLAPDGSLTVSRELPAPILPPGDPAALATPYRDPRDARTLAPEPQPITDPTLYPERSK